jgi:outer membrane protein assembly factor BamD (BamD/ComL family)
MRSKLAQKAYENGMFYFRRRAYDAAVVYFEDAVTRFPDTHFAPTALLRMYESYQRIGYTEEAAEVRARLLRDYAASPEARGLTG